MKKVNFFLLSGDFLLSPRVLGSAEPVREDRRISNAIRWLSGDLDNR